MDANYGTSAIQELTGFVNCGAANGGATFAASAV